MKTKGKVSKEERDLVSKAFSALGKRGAAKLTKEQRKERARLAGIASGKARKKKAGKRG